MRYKRLGKNDKLFTSLKTLFHEGLNNWDWSILVLKLTSSPIGSLLASTLPVVNVRCYL